MKQVRNAIVAATMLMGLASQASVTICSITDGKDGEYSKPAKTAVLKEGAHEMVELRDDGNFKYIAQRNGDNQVALTIYNPKTRVYMTSLSQGSPAVFINSELNVALSCFNVEATAK